MNRGHIWPISYEENGLYQNGRQLRLSNIGGKYIDGRVWQCFKTRKYLKWSLGSRFMANLLWFGGSEGHNGHKIHTRSLQFRPKNDSRLSNFPAQIFELNPTKSQSDTREMIHQPNENLPGDVNAKIIRENGGWIDATFDESDPSDDYGRHHEPTQETRMVRENLKGDHYS